MFSHVAQRPLPVIGLRTFRCLINETRVARMEKRYNRWIVAPELRCQVRQFVPSRLPPGNVRAMLHLWIRAELAIMKPPFGVNWCAEQPKKFRSFDGP